MNKIQRLEMRIRVIQAEAFKQKTRAETWKRLWKAESVKYDNLIENAVDLRGRGPKQITDAVIKEWIESGSKRTREDLIKRGVVFALCPLE